MWHKIALVFSLISTIGATDHLFSSNLFNYGSANVPNVRANNLSIATADIPAANLDKPQVYFKPQNSFDKQLELGKSVGQLEKPAVNFNKPDLHKPPVNLDKPNVVKVDQPQVIRHVPAPIEGNPGPINEQIKKQLLLSITGLFPTGSAKSVSKVSAIAEPIIFKSIAVPSLAAQKTSNIISMTPLLLEALFNDAKATGDEFVQNKIQAINKASNKFVSGVKTVGKVAVGLAVKGATTVKKGVKVVGGILLKPVFFVVGSQMKILGTGLKVLGAGTKLVGTAIKDAGKALKSAGLGAVGFGATAIGWGTDTSTIPPFKTMHNQPHPQPEPHPAFNNPQSSFSNQQSVNNPQPSLNNPQLPMFY